VLESEAMSTDLGVTVCGDREFRWGERTFMMGVLNLTPDSFSGDGLGDDIAAALSRAERLVAEGADILDVGGESTRPQSSPISADEELRRVIPVIERLAGEVAVPISIDTYKLEVARPALQAGARMINDVWGLKRNPSLAQLAAEWGVPLVIAANQRETTYDQIIPEVIAFLRRGIDLARDAGVAWENIIIDPGIGFGKSLEGNLELMRRLSELKVLGRPILLGTSRKSMIGLVLNLPPEQRLEGTAATIALGIAGGADIVRVHDVLQMGRVSQMADAIIRGRWT
jgi:dihydropteroate synthase